MIAWVDAWFAEHADDVRSRGLTVGVTRSPADWAKRSVVVLLDAGDAVGQLIVWESGEAMSECGGVVSGLRTPRVLEITDAAVVAEVLGALVREVENALD